MGPTNEAQKLKPFRILSLDGGGSKGFYTIGILEEIEAMTGGPLYKHFDLIFGTSTGSIIAALLARGDSVQTVRNLYTTEVSKIMRCRNRWSRSAALKRVTEGVFGKTQFADFKTRVGIVASRWEEERPLIFKSSADMAYGTKDSFVPGFGCSISEAIVASCSAYPFFTQPTVTTSKGHQILAADGGFCANNPTLYAISDAIGPLERPPESLRVVSLGVGSYPEPKTLLTWFKLVPGVKFIQKILGINTCSMEWLRTCLFSHLDSIRISDTFSEPELATDFLERDRNKLNRLLIKGQDSFRKNEIRLRELILG